MRLVYTESTFTDNRGPFPTVLFLRGGSYSAVSSPHGSRSSARGVARTHTPFLGLMVMVLRTSSGT